jgi:hypothetical protein
MINKKIYCYDLDKEFNNAVDASRNTGVCRSSITKVCTGQRATAGGMLWCYSKDKDKLFKKCAV